MGGFKALRGVGIAACLACGLLANGAMATGLKLCVPEKHNQDIMTPKANGLCEAKYTLTELGAEGPAGEKGAAGKTGATGRTGATGPTGPVGSQGTAGEKGATGPSGGAGATGSAGATGATGAIGAPGATGGAGVTGPAGATGAVGVSGATVTSGLTCLINDVSSGTLWTTLRAAVNVAKDGDTLDVTGICEGSAVIHSNRYLVIQGLGSAVLSGDSTAGPLLEVENSASLTVTGITLTGGGTNTSSEGGGIQNEGALTLNDSTVKGNTGELGGGIGNGGTLTLNNSTVSGNTAFLGGGISNSGTLILDDSTVSGNTAEKGGGIDNGVFEGIDAASLTLSGSSSVTKNKASIVGSGGGIYNLENDGAKIIEELGWSGTVSENEPDNRVNA